MNEKLPVPPPPSKLDVAEQERLARKFKDSISSANSKLARASAVTRETEAIFGDAKSVAKRKLMLNSTQIDRYATALANLGDFRTAHKYDSTKGYDAIDKAIWRDDDATCHCKPIKSMGQDGVVKTYPRTFVSQVIRSVKHNGEVNLTVCNDCGFMNAK